MTGAIPLPKVFKHRLLDMKLGFALMRDRRVPMRSKLGSVVLGMAVTGVVEFLEIPVEGVLAALLPILGLAGDFVLDGAEMVAGPLVLATLLLPFVAPREVVDRVLAERATGNGGKVVDV